MFWILRMLVFFVMTYSSAQHFCHDLINLEWWKALVSLFFVLLWGLAMIVSLGNRWNKIKAAS